MTRCTELKKYFPQGEYTRETFDTKCKKLFDSIDIYSNNYKCCQLSSVNFINKLDIGQNRELIVTAILLTNGKIEPYEDNFIKLESGYWYVKNNRMIIIYTYLNNVTGVTLTRKVVRKICCKNKFYEKSYNLENNTYVFKTNNIIKKKY